MVGPRTQDLLDIVRDRQPVELSTRDGLTRLMVCVLSRALWDDQGGDLANGLIYLVGVRCTDTPSDGDVVYVRYDASAQTGAFITAMEFREFAERAMAALRQESDGAPELP